MQAHILVLENEKMTAITNHNVLEARLKAVQEDQEKQELK